MCSRSCSLIILFCLQRLYSRGRRRKNQFSSEGRNQKRNHCRGWNLWNIFWEQKQISYGREHYSRIPRQRVLRERVVLRLREKGLWHDGGAEEMQHGVITPTQLGGMHVHDGDIHCVCEGFFAGSSQEKKKN